MAASHMHRTVIARAGESQEESFPAFTAGNPRILIRGGEKQRPGLGNGVSQSRRTFRSDDHPRMPERIRAFVAQHPSHLGPAENDARGCQLFCKQDFLSLFRQIKTERCVKQIFLYPESFCQQGFVTLPYLFVQER